jgi:Flp pilus assembly protein TadD
MTQGLGRREAHPRICTTSITALNRATQATTKCERALTLDRNLAFAQAEIGVAQIVLGRAEEAEVHVKDALRLSPRESRHHRQLRL